MKQFFSLVLVLALPTTLAFAPSPSVGTSPSSRRLDPLRLAPEHVDAFTTAMDQWQHVMASSSNLLADAADAAADASKDTGWWQSYLSIFKSSLELVHSTIDGPLRSVGITQTWGVSIFIFTALVRSLLLPLSVQQSKATEYMKALKPYMAEIKTKFKDNQDMQNRAIAKLYEDAKQNPLSGCLFSLAQLPIFLGLYRGVRLLAIDGELDEPFLWIPSLQGPVGPPSYRGLEWLTEGWTDVNGISTPSLGWETTLAFLVMPVVLVLGQSLTMKVLQPDMGEDDSMSAEEKENMERTQGFLKFLPLLIGFFSLQVPAGLTIYWFTSNIYSLTQALVVRQYYAINPPEIELPDYWEALDDVESMSADDRRKAAEAGLSTGPSFQDMQDEAAFHYVVKRGPLRAQSDAWKRVESGSRSVPTEMQAWVASGPAITKNVVVEAEESETATIEAAKSEAPAVEAASQ